MSTRPFHVLCLLVSWLTAPCAQAQPKRDSAVSENVSACRYVVAYSAPETCPDAAMLERRLGPHYRVEEGAMATCDDCRHGVAIADIGNGVGYRMRLAGLEDRAVDRVKCEELFELAVYAIEASALSAPECRTVTTRVGLSVTPFANVSNNDPMLFAAARVTLPLDTWQLTAFGSWLVPTTVQNRASGTAIEEVTFAGYAAGLEGCRQLFPNVSVCGAGMWRRLEGKAVGQGWDSVKPSNIWTLGGGVAWEVSIASSLRFEVSPSVMAVLGGPHLAEETVSEPLYSHSGIEALLRVGFSWEFLGRDTPANGHDLRGDKQQVRSSDTGGTQTNTLTGFEGAQSWNSMN